MQSTLNIFSTLSLRITSLCVFSVFSSSLRQPSFQCTAAAVTLTSPPPPRQTFRRWGENIEQSVILILTRVETKHKEGLISSSFFFFPSPGFLMFGTSESLVGRRRRSRMRRRGRHDFFTHDGVEKAWFHLDLFPLHPSLSKCGMMCNFHTRKPSGIIKRHFCSGNRCVWNSKHRHASHISIFLQCTENVIDLERKTEELTARMLVHTLTFEKHHNTPLQALLFII